MPTAARFHVYQVGPLSYTKASTVYVQFPSPGSPYMVSHLSRYAEDTFFVGTADPFFYRRSTLQDLKTCPMFVFAMSEFSSSCGSLTLSILYMTSVAV